MNLPISKFNAKPGITVELSPTLNAGGWSSCQLIRFFSGRPQKMGGWQALAGVKALIGTCRGLFGWADLLGTAYLAAGTEQRLSVISGGLVSDITPVVSTSNIAPAIVTTAGSSTVQIQDSTASPSIGDWIYIPTHISQGGLVLVGFYQIGSIIDGNNFTVTAASPATLSQPLGGVVPAYTTTSGSSNISVFLPNHGLIVGSVYNAQVSTTVAGVVIFGNYVVSSVTDAGTFSFSAASSANAATTASVNGGQARIQYLLPSGYSVATSLGGYGVGDFGAGDWGLASNSTVTAPLRYWSLDHFGQALIASPRNGGVYYWTPPNITPAAVLSASAPLKNAVVFCMSQAQIVIAAGSSTGSTQFPTLIRWSDSGDFSAWTPTAANQAGSFQLPTGSFVVAGLAIGLGALIWTDNALWTMTYQGLPFVFGFNQIAVNCEAMSARAPAAVGNLVVWPSLRSFFLYDGNGVRPIECPVWDYFYNNLDFTQIDQVCSGVNTAFNEVSWYFPMTGGGTGYVKWNYLEQVWDYGTLDRTAWYDHNPYCGPVGADSNGFLQEHEVSPDAGFLPMQSYIQSGFMDVHDGTELIYVRVLIPDFVASAGSSIQLTILATDYPGDTPRQYGPYTVTPTTRYVNTSLRGRQIALRIASNDLGSFWRLGALRYNWARAGRR